MRLLHVFRASMLAAMAVALSACGSPQGGGIQIDAGTHGGTLHLQDGAVVISARDRPDARVDAQGDLRIGGRPVALTAPQRALFVRYHRDAYALVDSGVAMGQAGAAMAGSVVGTVVSHLLRGDTRGIHSRAAAEAGAIRRKAAVLCTQLGALRQDQDAAAAALPAFAPYAVLGPDAASRCRRGLED